jgi:hypothetical protein
MITFVFFWVLIGFAYLADTKCNPCSKKQEDEGELTEQNVVVEFHEFGALEIC